MNLLIMGPPGAGKGTQAELIVEKYNIPHISTGDMFRAAISNKTDMGIKAKQFIDEGKLVPDSVTNGIVKERLSQEDCKTGFLLDGFPRTLEQAKSLNVILTEVNLSIDHVINIELADELLEGRIVGRRLCKDCGISFHVETRKPKVEGVCDKCGGELYQRKDDTKELVKTRLGIYHNQTKPILNFYEKEGLVRNINGLGSREEISENVFAQIEVK